MARITLRSLVQGHRAVRGGRHNIYESNKHAALLHSWLGKYKQCSLIDIVEETANT
jgi:hypothetical protein